MKKAEIFWDGQSAKESFEFWEIYEKKFIFEQFQFIESVWSIMLFSVIVQ